MSSDVRQGDGLTGAVAISRNDYSPDRIPAFKLSKADSQERPGRHTTDASVCPLTVP